MQRCEIRVEKISERMESLEGMGSRSLDLGAKLRMRSLTAYCDTFSTEENVTVVVQVTSVEVEETGSEAMLALSFSTSLLKCLMKRLGRLALA